MTGIGINIPEMFIIGIDIPLMRIAFPDAIERTDKRS
jgi:hypothetical protein